MEKNEILKKSRKENQGGDIFEAQVLLQSSRIAARAGMLLCCLAAVLEAALTGRINKSAWVVYFGMLTVTFLVKYAKLKCRHELGLTLLYGALCVFFLILYIRDLIG